MSNVMCQVPDSHPLMQSWNSYRKSKAFTNGFNWATKLVVYSRDLDENIRATDGQRGEWVKGSLWGAFEAGFKAATERAAMLHESVDPASDDERLNKVPGAGAMGAVIQYRDMIRV